MKKTRSYWQKKKLLGFVVVVGEEEREIDQNSLQDKIVVMPWRP